MSFGKKKSRTTRTNLVPWVWSSLCSGARGIKISGRKIGKHINKYNFIRKTFVVMKLILFRSRNSNFEIVL